MGSKTRVGALLWLGWMGVAAEAEVFVSFVPIDASVTHVINGNDIILDAPGGTVTLEIRISDWDPDDTGVQLRAVQIKGDSTGYTSGLSGSLSVTLVPCDDPGGDIGVANAVCEAAFEFGPTCEFPVSCDFTTPGECDCTPGYINSLNRNFVFPRVGAYPFPPIVSIGTVSPAVDTSTPDFRWAAAIQNPPFMNDPGSCTGNGDFCTADGNCEAGQGPCQTGVFPPDGMYAGTLRLDVSNDARGTFTLDFIGAPDSKLVAGTNLELEDVTYVPGHVTIKCQGIGDCEDNNECTDDTCNLDGTCSNDVTYNPATECCDPTDGTTLDIDDNNDCTVDMCNADGSVDHIPLADDTDCDDGLACNVNESCQGGFCAGGNPPDCAAAGNECNDASCNPAGSEGNCDTSTPVQDGTDCDDGLACNVGESCQGGMCTGGSAPDCSTEGDQCNEASCDLGGSEGNCTVLTPVANGTPCDDGLCCTQGESCQAGECTGGNADHCNDGLACTTDTCEEASAPDCCVNTLDAGNCLIDDVCYADFELNPGNDCEWCDSSSTTSGWSFVPDGDGCDDGDACTGTGREGIGVDTCDGAGDCSGVRDPQCNDECSFAVEVFEGVTTGYDNNNRGPDDAEASCLVGSFESNNDVWFVYTATCTGTIVISTTGSVFAPSNDPVLSLWDACPDDGGVEFACDDDSGVNLQALITFNAVGGVTYWLRVAGFEDSTGDIQLNIFTVNDCLIDGACFAEGGLNPSNDCQACRPELSTTSWSDRDEGSLCGDPTERDCDNADACNGNGVCEPNHKEDGTECTDEGEFCTFDECLAGVCEHPPKSAGVACGDPSDSECDHPDTCDGTGACQPNYEPMGSSCGDGSSDQCDFADQCDGDGACDDNLAPNGTSCDDGDVCTGDDICTEGTCDGTAIPEAPVVSAVGPRHLIVTPQPAASVSPVALRLTSPNDWPCLVKYINASGFLVGTPVFRLPDDWGSVVVRGPDIVPESEYYVQAECGAFLSGPGIATTSIWGDVVGLFTPTGWAPPDGIVDIFSDVVAILDGFRGAPTAPPLIQIDLVGSSSLGFECTPDAFIDIFDILADMDAFRGIGYQQITGCPVPCP